MTSLVLGVWALLAQPTLEPAAPRFTECLPGETASCACSSQLGMTIPGRALCTDSGRWAACGCEEAWPYLGPSCGSIECPPVAPESGGYDGRHCCTEGGACGIESPEAFGASGPCVEIGHDLGGVPDEEACGLRIPFVETVSCCRSDDRCGIWFPYANWDQVGCMEQAEVASYLKGNFVLRLLLIFNPFSLDDVETRNCVHPGD